VSASTSSWLRPLKKVLIGISIFVGLYLFTFVVARLVVNSLFRGIESSRATGLSALGLPYYQSAEDLLRTGEKNVVRAVSMGIDTPSLDSVQSRVEEIVRKSDGFFEEFKVYRSSGSAPWLQAKLRLPVNSLSSALQTLGSFGVVKRESEASEDSNAEKESLTAQLESTRAELARLNEIVRRHKGSLGEAVQAEGKLAERRKEADELEDRLKKLGSRVEYALVELQITEQYQAHLDWRAALASSDLRNSLIEGLDAVLASFGIVLGFLLRYGLVLFVWATILYWPSRSIWRRYRRSHPLPSTANA
jgi:hypothetical protein